jgi:hypothetical protein
MMNPYLLSRAFKFLLFACIVPFAVPSSGFGAEPDQPAERPISLSGIYPHLAMFNAQGECGTGAVVPWAGRLWVVTYSPHQPRGSNDKLYEIDDALEQTIREESIGGTPANRMIHRESQQLFIGPYAIDAQRHVRAIPYTTMFGRPTGNARHLTDPANKIYYATMEEGFYEVDVHSLAVKELWADEQKKEGRHANLPGYHGKGLYSSQGRLVYSNNGEHGGEALRNPRIASGVLAEWDGKADQWTIVRRNQFTEVTGPGGIYGNEHPATDPIWSLGWDARSLILMVLDAGEWHSYRLPKASHAYDGAHGWNVEWPRIRDVGERDLLMTMHGMFWHFPRDFRPGHTAGIAPRSSYLKVVADFCQWHDRILLACDDAAKSEFLNTSRLKGKVAGPGESQSNLVFLQPEQIDQFGPALGRGAVWLRESVKADAPSDAYLFAGFARRGLQLEHSAKTEVVFTLETDAGEGNWQKLRSVAIAPGKATWVPFAESERAAWIRVTADRDLASASAVFHYSGRDERTAEAAPIFAGIAAADETNYLAGVLHDRGNKLRTLAVGAVEVADNKIASRGLYELSAKLELRPLDDTAALAALEKDVAVPTGVLKRDSASAIAIDNSGRRWRLPQNVAFATEGAVPLRVAREVVTERNLLNVDGTFYELPAENAGGFAGLRPIATHNRRIADYASYRGLMVLTGIDSAADKPNPHIIRSVDGRAAVWAGSIDDLWSLGKPVGVGGPWLKTAVKAGVASDPYLLTGYDQKTLTLAHDAQSPVALRVEVDFAGDGQWSTYDTFEVSPGKSLTHVFPSGYGAYWLRIVPAADCTATAQLVYE